MAGRAGTLMAIVGVLAFFLGLFGPVRTPVFAGVALIALALCAYFVEELAQRRS